MICVVSQEVWRLFVCVSRIFAHAKMRRATTERPNFLVRESRREATKKNNSLPSLDAGKKVACDEWQTTEEDHANKDVFFQKGRLGADGKSENSFKFMAADLRSSGKEREEKRLQMYC